MSWRRIRAWLPWTVVRIFGRLSYFNISYGVLFLVPILHELYVRGVPAMTWFGAPVDFPITLQWLYAASLSYAAAILLYQIFCPGEIKRHSEAVDYTREQFELFQRFDPQHRVDIVLARLSRSNDAETRETIEQLFRTSRSALSVAERTAAQAELDALLEKLHDHAVQAYLADQWEDENQWWPFARWLSLLFYLLGSLIVGALLVERSVAVFHDFKEGEVLIKSELAAAQNELLLLAYTFQDHEFEELELILKRSDVEPQYSPIDKDQYGRTGRRYYVPLAATPRLGANLGGGFNIAGQFVPHSAVSGGKKCACREMKVGGRNGKGCENLEATDDVSARIACDLLAGKNGWYFGQSSLGTCSAKKSSWRIWE
jgi:hypothetical protein